jgi:hypothetical protein
MASAELLRRDCKSTACSPFQLQNAVSVFRPLDICSRHLAHYREEGDVKGSLKVMKPGFIAINQAGRQVDVDHLLGFSMAYS